MIKFIKVIKFFTQKLFFTTKLKFWVTEWVIGRKYIKNWFQWYLVCTSFLIHVLQRIVFLFYENNFTFKANYKNGLKFDLPWKFYLNNWDDPWKLAYYKYFDSFHRHYNSNIKINENDVIIDIGAHHGGFGSPLIYHNKGANLISVEPDLENYRTLQLTERNFTKF